MTEETSAKLIDDGKLRLTEVVRSYILREDDQNKLQLTEEIEEAAVALSPLMGVGGVRTLADGIAEEITRDDLPAAKRPVISLDTRKGRVQEIVQRALASTGRKISDDMKMAVRKKKKASRPRRWRVRPPSDPGNHPR